MEEKTSEKPKRRHSVSRIFQKLKPKRKSTESKDLGFMSLRSSSTNLSSIPSEVSSLGRKESLLETKSLRKVEPIEQEKFVTLATFNCVLFHQSGVVQGRLYLTDVFFVFDSKTLTVTVRIKMEWKEVLDIRLRSSEGEQTILVNGVKERYSFGRFILNPSMNLQDVVSEMTKAWGNASKRKSIDASTLVQGPRWPCGCLTHLPNPILTNVIVRALPFELFEKLFTRSAWVSTFKELQGMEEHGAERPFVPEVAGGERVLTHVIKKQSGGSLKIQQHQTLERFEPGLISVTSKFRENENVVATMKWCFIRESNFPNDATRVFLGSQGESHLVQSVCTRFIDEEFKHRFTFLRHIKVKDESYLWDNIRFLWAMAGRPRLEMFEGNIWLLVAIWALYHFGSLLTAFYKSFYNAESPLMLLPHDQSASANEDLVKEIQSHLGELQKILLG